jgi:hypothetical protein
MKMLLRSGIGFIELIKDIQPNGPLVQYIYTLG